MFLHEIVSQIGLNEHFAHLVRALDTELAQDRETHTHKIATVPLQELKAEGYCRYPLHVKETGYGAGDYPFMVAEHRVVEGAVNRFSPGQSAVLFMTAEKERREISCTVNFVGADRIKLIFTCDELPEWIDEGKLGVMPDTDLRTYKECKKAITRVMEAKGDEPAARIRDTVYGLRSPEFRTDIAPIHDPMLNASQNEALMYILTAKDIAVVHGPPGTGKTTIITAALRHLCKTEGPVLVSAPSNAAADLLTKNILEAGMKPVRIGNLSKIDEQLLTVTPEELIKNEPGFKEIKKFRQQANEYRRMAMQYKRSFGKDERMQRNLLLKEAKTLSGEAVKTEEYLIEKVIREAHAIITTPVGAAHSWLRRTTFDTVIVDECAQATEPLAWIPALKGKRLIMAGDHLQLPPTILSDEAKKMGLEHSLLSYAVRYAPQAVVLSSIQYRMHSHIMNFPSQQFYESRLQAHESVAGRALDDMPVQWLDTAGCGFEELKNEKSAGISNAEEARLVMMALNELLEKIPSDTQIAIIAPYRKQVELLTQALANHAHRKRIEVGTVDAFQGREADAVILSLTRSNDKNEIGFLSDLRRMNVAITRAKSKLIVVGDSATVCSNPFFSAFFDYVEGLGGYRSACELM